MYNGENDMQSRKILQDCDYTKVCFIPLFHTGPESHELPRIDKYLDSCLNLTQFVKILTDSHSP